MTVYWVSTAARLGVMDTPVRVSYWLHDGVGHVEQSLEEQLAATERVHPAGSRPVRRGGQRCHHALAHSRTGHAVAVRTCLVVPGDEGIVLDDLR